MNQRETIPLLMEENKKLIHTNEYYELKTRIHDRLLDLIDLSLLDSLDREFVRHEIRKLVARILQEERSLPLNYDEKERLYMEIQDEVLGLGPLEPFLQDPTVSDILVNTYKSIYVEKYGKMEKTEARFKDDAHLRKIIDKIVFAVGRRIDESCPMVDARLPDGSRVNAIIPPVSIDGPSLSVRRFAVEPLELDDLIGLRTLTPEIGELFKGIVRARLNILISGGTGSGKTTLLNVLSRFIPANERVITIEDSAELQLKQEHVVRLEMRPQNIEGKGEITPRDLVRNSLRMRPDRIIIGEVRGGEVLDMLQAMNTGHDGSLTTIHANSPRDALLRLETLVAMNGLNITIEAIRRYISSALNIIIQVSRHVDGSRKVVSFQEITGMEGDVITTQEIFTFEQTGIDEAGKVKGQFRANGIMPKFFEQFKAMNIDVPYEIFDPRNVFAI
ncbi:MAG TPA: pilus assembly protein CpaF [Deltaproteobacteria bacterium]|nr:MAG: pilus assembly protein CpaF [Deltaproteobacteria bacterium GWA2_55_82]OGQ62250.1 MAG: pilus assembly protein CpaF [Deltaproteobacteria bacterium RIFCSPLOWO2_02_FULL_55_12]OIJ74362.1 MAG: pilus assembly protein CpaF [Deltaproteobacteria bacterium GWC2_55_46]HBG47006.1 pilus assembly protein CpaF [Deltaproteobacteria bacterium]HCY10934.1 pilus assembly protein CpaF [Deltaproteobacteria bacterium]